MLIGLEFFTLSWPEIDQIMAPLPFHVLLISLFSLALSLVAVVSQGCISVAFLFYFYVLVKGLVGIELP